MAKSARLAFSTPEKDKCRDHHCSIDRISVLPDELLVFILSFLPLKEATATSILSRRWRYLSTFVPKLDFDGMESLLKVIFEERKSQLALDRERSNFIRRVNHVIALHKGSTIKEFRVVFNLTKTYQECIDEWLRYALSRKVQRLELILTYNGSLGSRVYDECYTFPYKLLRTENVSNCSESCSVRQCKSIHFNYLKKISMKYVNVNGEALEFFLCNSPLLEDLSVCQSGELSTLKITGPFPSFKRLEISFCNNLNSVEIRGANLVCLKYEGARIHFLLENVPLLVEIFVGGMLTERMEDVFFLFSSCLPQLEIFTIVIMDMFSWEETEKFYSAVKMSNLKQLVVEVWRNFDTLLPLTNLICASPCLQRFVLMASHSKLDFVKRKIEKIVRSYPHLKKVEFVGYRGVISELELVMHFLENAVALEKILVDPHERDDLLDEICYRYYYIDDEYIEDEISARRRAKKQLSKKVPPRINLKIL